jgi:hypothetical protein
MRTLRSVKEQSKNKNVLNILFNLFLVRTLQYLNN